MRRNKRYAAAALVFLILLLILIIRGLGTSAGEEKKYSVSVIVENSSDDRWTALREGLQEGALDNNVRLNYVSTGEFVGANDELDIIRREIESGADGIILCLYDSAGMYEELEDLLSRDSVVLLESDAEPEAYYQTVGADNLEMGRALAGQILSDPDAAGKTVGILCGNTLQLAMQQRLQGLTEGLSGSGVSVVWTLERDTDPEHDALAQAQQDGRADILVALDNRETERAVDYLISDPELAQQCTLYGVGNSEKVVYYLDKGVIRTLVAPVEFYMGYQSVKELSAKLQNHGERENVTTEYLVVDRTNLYDEANQKILFPIVQ